MSQTLSTAVLPRPVAVAPRRGARTRPVEPAPAAPKPPAGSGVAGVLVDLLGLLVALVFVVAYAVVMLAILGGRLVGRRVLAHAADTASRTAA